MEDFVELGLASGQEFLKEFGASDDAEDNAVFFFKPFDDKLGVVEKDFKTKRLEVQAYKNLYPHLAVANKY